MEGVFTSFYGVFYDKRHSFFLGRFLFLLKINFECENQILGFKRIEPNAKHIIIT